MLILSAMDVNNYYPENTSWDFFASYVADLLERPNVSIDYINQVIARNI